MSKASLYIFCGKMASGKSTLARQLSEQHELVLISEDVLLARLYPDKVVDVPTYARYSARLKSAMAPLLVDLLRTGSSVVLDFPANTVKQRKWFRDILLQADAQAQFHYLNCSDETCKARLRERARRQPERQATDTVEMFDAISRYFEPPGSEEGFVLIQHDQG